LAWSVYNVMHLVYDRQDLEYAQQRGDLRLQWLQDLGAIPIQELAVGDAGFLFGYQRPADEFASIVQRHPLVRDRPNEREELARLEDILRSLSASNLTIPTPRTWILAIDDPLPSDLVYPLFIRTSTSSWKRGGHVSKVRNERELLEECELLRRAFRWDATILAREWLDLAAAGQWRYGSIPIEIRVWIVDSIPCAWSFHYLHVVPKPEEFPPSSADLRTIAQLARQIAVPFSSRLVAADFVRDRSGGWYFLEAGPGACSGTAHKMVFKAVASRLVGRGIGLPPDAVGGLLPNDD